MVVGVTGHQDIPDAALAFLEKEITRVLRHLGKDFTGVSSLAAGADQLFAEIVLQLGGHLHVVIPCERYEETFIDRQTFNTFRHLLEKADIVETLKHGTPSEKAFLDAGHRVVELSNVLVAVWDGREARGKGGTADIVHYARERGIDVVVVWPPGIARQHSRLDQ
jgi:predicted Rossmann fold nucleotide-binding protein DprA/Smf involved in DNA uptake